MPRSSRARRRFAPTRWVTFIGQASVADAKRSTDYESRIVQPFFPGDNEGLRPFRVPGDALAQRPRRIGAGEEPLVMACYASYKSTAYRSLFGLTAPRLTFVANKIHCLMPTAIKSEAFAEWIDNLRDRAGAAQVLRRLARLERGNPGRVAPVGEGVSELKIDFGPGYRVYYGQRGEELVIILGGGDKSSQDRDIQAAKKLWDEWKEQTNDES